MNSSGHATYKKPAAERNDAGRYSCVAMTDNQLTEEVIKKFEIEVHVTSVGRVPLIGLLETKLFVLISERLLQDELLLLTLKLSLF